MSTFFLDKVISGDRVKHITVDFDKTGFCIRAEAVGENDEFSAAEPVAVDKVAASEGKSRRMRQ
jgi:type VI secretion system protein VasG